MRFAKWVFLIAGFSGLFMIIPPFFLEAKTGEDYPPPITHPEFYYGFFGVTLAWQILFLIIAWDPVRFRPAMLAGIVEKASFVVAIAVLYALGRVAPVLLGFAAMDGVWGALFIAAFLRTPRA